MRYSAATAGPSSLSPATSWVPWARAVLLGLCAQLRHASCLRYIVRQRKMLFYQHVSLVSSSPVAYSTLIGKSGMTTQTFPPVPPCLLRLLPSPALAFPFPSRNVATSRTYQFSRVFKCCPSTCVLQIREHHRVAPLNRSHCDWPRCVETLYRALQTKSGYLHFV